MGDLVALYIKLLLRSFAGTRWLQWLLGVSLIVVVVGLIPVAWRGGDVLLPFSILALDLPYTAALSVLLLVFAFVFVTVVGIPVFRYGGVWLMSLGIGVFGYQLYGYVRFEEWQSFALRDFTDVAFLTVGLGSATGWLKGILRAFLEQTPLSLSLVACGVVWHVWAKKALDYELQDLKGIERERLKPMDEARPQPRLAIPPGRWLPTRLYRRTAEKAVQPPGPDALFREAKRTKPQATKLQQH